MLRPSPARRTDESVEEASSANKSSCPTRAVEDGGKEVEQVGHDAGSPHFHGSFENYRNENLLAPSRGFTTTELQRLRNVIGYEALCCIFADDGSSSDGKRPRQRIHAKTSNHKISLLLDFGAGAPQPRSLSIVPDRRWREIQIGKIRTVGYSYWKKVEGDCSTQGKDLKQDVVFWQLVVIALMPVQSSDLVGQLYDGVTSSSFHDSSRGVSEDTSEGALKSLGFQVTVNAHTMSLGNGDLVIEQVRLPYSILPQEPDTTLTVRHFRRI